jgi:hypothetical protein
VSRRTAPARRIRTHDPAIFEWTSPICPSRLARSSPLCQEYTVVVKVLTIADDAFRKSRRHYGERLAAQVVAGNLSHRPTRPAGRGHEQIAKPQKAASQDQRAGKESLTVPDPTRVAQHPRARIPNCHDSSTDEFGTCHADVISTPHDSMRYRDHGGCRGTGPGGIWEDSPCIS